MTDWFVIGVLVFLVVVLQMFIATVVRVSVRHPPYCPLHGRRRRCHLRH